MQSMPLSKHAMRIRPGETFTARLKLPPVKVYMVGLTVTHEDGSPLTAEEWAQWKKELEDDHV